MNAKVIVSRFGGPEVLKLHQSTIPEPKAGELIIKVAYSGIGAIDAIMREGELGDLNLQPPFTPGIEVSGKVHAVGGSVTGFRRGQAVAAIMLPDGGYAQYVRAKAALTIPLPSGELLPATASIVNLAAAHLLATQMAKLAANDSVAIHGASGGLGTACIQVFRYLQPSAQLTATVRNASKKAYVQGLGCHIALTADEFFQKTKKEEHSYSLIIDPVGGELRRASLAALKPYGKLLAVGNVSGDHESTISSQQLWLEGKAVLGFKLALFAALYSEKVQDAMQDIVDALANDKLSSTPSTIFSLDKVQDAHRYLHSDNLKGRVLLKVE